MPKIFGKWLHTPDIWHITRHSAASGVATGLFCAFIPFPVQTICAAAFAILFRFNLPLAIIASLVGNPLTMPVMFYLAYKIGAMILDIPVDQAGFQFSLEWLRQTLNTNWKPLILGCSIAASLCSLTGYFVVRLLWRMSLVSKWKKRPHHTKNGF